jgi:ribonuclease E
MLISALRPEEVRIAIVSGSTLDNYQVEVADHTLTRGNIYRGVIANREPALNAAFVDYGSQRHGFLAIQDVVDAAFHREPTGDGRPRIEDVLERGRPVLVQVTKDAEAGKGAALTTSLSLAGRYLVFTPFDDTRGVSRKVEDEDTRLELKALAAKLDVPAGGGVIVRTNSLGQSKTELARDLAALLRLWKRIEADADRGKGPKLLYSDQDLILRALRDYLDASIEEVLVDDEAAFVRAEEYLRAFLPRGKARLVHYTERAPLFARFDLEGEIDRIYDRKVALPGGGSIVIDRTEALTAIDVNSGKARGASSQAETALATNLEAAREVARQLLLRDLGGLVVVDFIDLAADKHRRQVERELKEAMKVDKARSTVGRISGNGLLEINRQRIQQALALRTHRACPTCDGTGRIPSPEMVSLSLLRRIEARAAGGAVGRARIALHPELADAFQNARRQEIAALEREFGLAVEVIAAPHLHRAQQEVEWFDREPGTLPPPRPPAERPIVRAAELVVEPPAALAEDLEGPPAGKKGGKKRKRRGRKKGRTAGLGERLPAGNAAPRQAGGGAGQAGEASVGGHGRAEAGTRGKKRRRGGRRHKKGKHTAEPVAP